MKEFIGRSGMVEYSDEIGPAKGLSHIAAAIECVVDPYAPAQYAPQPAPTCRTIQILFGHAYLEATSI